MGGLYTQWLDGGTPGEAVRGARETLYALRNKTSAWGAYQHYGDPTRTVY